MKEIKYYRLAIVVVLMAAAPIIIIMNNSIQDKEKTIEEQNGLLQVHEGNTFNLRDDIAVLQDSIRLIKSGDIQFERDTLNKIK
jgi:hypothetical protein